MDSAFQIDEATLTRAARILARLRVDWEGGGGTNADMVRAVAMNTPNSASLHRSLERVHERAERNVRDVIGAIIEAQTGEDDRESVG